jgi:transglutaminase-like putative cysteine protease
MRIRVVHETVYTYDPPATGIIQVLRLTPRNHDGQYILRWRIEMSEDCRLDQDEDAFGNITHIFTAGGPLAHLGIAVDGEVETQDQHGIVRGAVERFTPNLYLRDSPLTAADAAIAAYAAEQRAEGGAEVAADPLALLHRLLSRLHEDMTYDPDPTHVATTAAEAFALRRGVCQDLTHVFIAASRSLGIPARYVSGYFRRTDGTLDQEAGHAWAEAFVPALGWVAFDPANGICATDTHIRVAVGLDYLGAAPVRGSRYGGGAETLRVAVQVGQSGRQIQG